MGYGSAQKGGGMTARQKGGGGFSPQMPYQPTVPRQDLSQALGQGIVALGGRGGGMNMPQRSPYMTPMQQVPDMYNSRLMMQRPFDRGAQTVTPQDESMRQAQAQAQMEAVRQNQARLTPQPRDPYDGMRSIGVMPGAVQPPSTDMGMRNQPFTPYVAGETYTRPEVDVDALRQGVSSKGAARAARQTPRPTSGIASLGGGKGASRAAPQLGRSAASIMGSGFRG